jgi:hypothetical protein
MVMVRIDDPFSAQVGTVFKDYGFYFNVTHRNSGDGAGHSPKLNITIGGGKTSKSIYSVTFTPKQLMKLVKELSLNREYEGYHKCKGVEKRGDQTRVVKPRKSR